MEAALVAQAHVLMHVLMSVPELAEETAAAVPEHVQAAPEHVRAVLRNAGKAANTRAILPVPTPVPTLV